MMRLLRRCRLLALALLLATPAAGGAWLQAAHPCPSEAPWIGQDTSGEHEHGHGHGRHEGTDACHCVGTCAGVALAVLATPSELPLAVVPASPARPRILPIGAPPAPRPFDRLPPATAPPLA